MEFNVTNTLQEEEEPYHICGLHVSNIIFAAHVSHCTYERDETELCCSIDNTVIGGLNELVGYRNSARSQ